MIKDKSVRYLDNSEVRLTVTVPKEEVRGAYDELVAEYCRKASIPGFRKGKVPPAVLIRKFGDALLEEAEENLIRKSFEEAAKDVERKPLPYGMPYVVDEEEERKREEDKKAGKEGETASQPAQGEHDRTHDEHDHTHGHAERKRLLDLDRDLTFTISYDTYPQIELGAYKGIEVEKHEYEITEKDIQRELDALQEQNALIVDKKDGAVEKGNIITISFAEVDDRGQDKPATRRQGFSFEVGTGYNLYGLDDDVIGMKSGEQKTVDKSYPDDYQHKEIGGRSVRVRVSVDTIRQKSLPPIDDELAQDISDRFKGLEDLRQDIRKRLDEAAQNAVRSRMVAAILDTVYLASKVPLPRAMINLQLASNWQTLLRQLRGDDRAADRYLESVGRTRHDMLEHWKPEAERRLKSSLIVATIMEREKIEVTDEEVEARIREIAERRNTTVEDVRNRVRSDDIEEEIKSAIRERKMEETLLAAAKVKRGQRMSFLDLVRANV